ncbi:MAG: sensor histidine kinase [Gammaproteobacteria bacterium]|nr:sensor histidine kinase [Gammaproteobacteria bacterium]
MSTAVYKSEPDQSASSANTANYLPNFCEGEMVFSVILVAELIAIVYSLTQQLNSETFWTTLASASMLLLWIALCSAAALCLVRRFIENKSLSVITIVSMALLVLVTIFVSEIVFWVGRHYAKHFSGSLDLFPYDHFGFLWPNVLISIIVSALVLRYFYVNYQWQVKLNSESQSRIQALQARIRPHFLFNSMNTIAYLVRGNPDAAEQAIEDLSDLFRASLNKSKQLVKLSEEIIMAKMNQRMEELRLGERLKVTWQIDKDLLDSLVPSLVLQPLLENAIYHGIETLPGGGEVTIHGQRQDNTISIAIVNPTSPKPTLKRRSGHQIALANIDERLQLAFGTGAGLDVSPQQEQFTVTLRFPYSEKQKSAMEASA